jgi:hypothetical protein
MVGRQMWSKTSPEKPRQCSLTTIFEGSFHRIKRQIPKGGPPGFPPMGVVEIPGVTRKSHKSNITIINPSQADWALLGANKSVILSPESIEGPFCKCCSI